MIIVHAMKYALLILIILSSNAVIGQSTPEKPTVSDQAQIERERTPDLEKFYAVLESADRIVVINDSEAKEIKLFESSKESDLSDLKSALKVSVPDEWRASICTFPSVVFYKGNERLMSVGNVLGREVKTSLWSGNILLDDPEKWLQWFDKRGMPEVRAERDRAETADRKNEADRERWYAAMPRGIGQLVEKQMVSFGLPSMGHVDDFGPVLEREYPSKDARILALLHWFGSGSGLWNGTPDYESITENVLFLFTTKEILTAIGSRTMSETETEGAARLFSGWDYSRERPADLKMLPDALRQKFLAHALKTDNEEKRQIAKKAFGKSK